MDNNLIDEVYMLITERNGVKGIWYSPPQTNTLDTWKAAYKYECALFEFAELEPYEKFRSRMTKDGWKARKVKISA